MKTEKKTAIGQQNALRVVSKTRPSYEDISLTNPRKEALTPTILRSFEGFEAVSDEEAENVCRTSLLLAQILLQYLAHKNITSIDNQQVVYSMGDNEAPVIEMDDHKSKPCKNKAA